MFSYQRKSRLYFILGILGIAFLIPVFAQAISIGQERSFNIQSAYDLSGRGKIDVELIKITNKIYFYADQQWLNKLSLGNKQEIDNKLYNLSSEFEHRIYPILTQTFGFEDNPGIDNDSKMIIVLHKMKNDIGGYIQTEDHYSSQVFSNSNEGQIIYLNADNVLLLSSNSLNYHLAHEFMHIITLKQNPNEETWLNEARAEYTETLLDYTKDWANSSVKNRLERFLINTNISLVDWNNGSNDYAEVNLLTHYLVDHYGINILIDSLHSAQSGINALNYALQKNGFSEDFSEVFMNWLIANVVNDCSVGEKYCYKNSYLQNFTIFPYSYYLPTRGRVSLFVTDSLNFWSAKLQKIVGGRDILKMKWNVPEETPISRIPYIIIQDNGQKKVGFLNFEGSNIDEIFVSDFGDKNIALITIPFLVSTPSDKLYYFSWEASVLENTDQAREEAAKVLQAKISLLKQEIIKLQAQLLALSVGQNPSVCSSFYGDLYYGMNSNQVSCLQQYLKSLGPQIYPEGLITGYFGPLTQAAVKRYQAWQGIITTGYFGPLTRTAANSRL